MKKSLIIFLILLYSAIIFSVVKAQNSNVNVTVSLTPAQYSNAVTFAESQGLTLQQFFTATNMSIVRDIRQRVIQHRIQNAFDKFRDVLTDQQKEQVVLLIESF